MEGSRLSFHITGQKKPRRRRGARVWGYSEAPHPAPTSASVSGTDSGVLLMNVTVTNKNKGQRAHSLYLWSRTIGYPAASPGLV